MGAAVTVEGLVSYDPTVLPGVQRQDPSYSGITDCGVWADADTGAGLLGSCNHGYGVAGMLGDPASKGLSPANGGVLGSSRNSPGVVGLSDNAAAVYASSSSGNGVDASSTSGNGVYAVSTSGDGVYAWSASGFAVSCHGQSNAGVVASSSKSTAVWATSWNGAGVYASGSGLSWLNAGVVGSNNGKFGTGIYGQAGDPLGNGVIGGGGSRGVWGLSSSGNGVQGQSASGSGVFGISSQAEGVRGVSVDGPGIYGHSYNGAAGAFDGDVNVKGTLTKGLSLFKIDHPLDPRNKFLYHAAVESPDMKNLYDGVSVLSASGTAVVRLPDWFDALNKELRYQLTPIGAPAPDLHVATEVKGNKFTIAGGRPKMRVCWQVTGVRKDAWANANRAPIEEAKKNAERGKFLHPDAFGASTAKAIFFGQPPETPKELARQQAQVRRGLARASREIERRRVEADRARRAEMKNRP